jgi:hypothetical protein
MRHPTALTVVAWVTVLAVAGCRGAAPKPAPVPSQIIWRSVGSWSGRGDSQTDSFTSDSGALRIRWQTTAGPPKTVAGSFRLTARSAISGRELEQAVDQRGPGNGTAYVSQDPHVFYMSVESSGLDWTFSVEEGIAGQVVGADPPR